MLQQETDVIPDRKLLQQISRSQEKDPYLDFFLALAICNTVVVSMATARRRRVSVPLIETVEKMLRQERGKNGPRCCSAWKNETRNKFSSGQRFKIQLMVQFRLNSTTEGAKKINTSHVDTLKRPAPGFDKMSSALMSCSLSFFL